MKKTLRLWALALLSIFSLSASAGSPYKTLYFSSETFDASVTNYTSEWTATVNGFTWNIANFNNNAKKWTYIKCGNKTQASVGTISNQSAIDKKIGLVLIDVSFNKATEVNSIKLEVSANSDFSSISETITLSDISNGEKTFEISNPIANGYYRLSFDCQKGAANGIVTLNKVEYYEEGTGPDVVTYPEVANIAALMALESGTKAKLTFNNVQVNFASDKDMYVQDATGAIDIFNCGLSYTAGQKLNGTAVVEYTLYNGMPEITSVSDAALTASTGEATPSEPSIEDVNSDLLCRLIKVTGKVYIENNEETGYTNYFLEDDDANSVQFYRKWSSLDGTDLSGLTDGATATVTGIVVLLNNTPAIGVTNIEYEGGEDIETVANIAALKAKAPTSKVRLTLTNAVVTFVNGKDMFVTDDSGSIDFYNCSLDYTAGKVLNGTIDVTGYTVYKNLPEITGVTNNQLETTDGTATPQEVAVTAVTDDMACAYVKVSGTVRTEVVTITPSTGDPYERTNYYLKDESNNEVPFYRKWSKLEGTDISVLSDDDTATITGIVVFTDGNAAIGVTAFEYESTNIENVTAENEANGPIYNLAGQRVEKTVKGIYIQNGKKFIVK